MLNKDLVIQYIEMHLGVPFQVLELDRMEINDIIDKFTLPIYSTYFPFYKKVKVTNSDSVGLGMYRLDVDEAILGVSKFISMNDSTIFDPNIYETPISVSSNILTNLSNVQSDFTGVGRGRIMAEFMQDEISINKLPTTYQFLEPNMVEVFPKNNYSYDWLCEMRTVHPTHLATIPTTQTEDFLKLCLYDVQIALYPIRSRFVNMNTAYGSIELFMEGLQDAKQNRNDLIEKFQGRFLKSGNRKKVFVY